MLVFVGFMQVLGLKWSFVSWMLWLGDYWSPLQIFIVLIMFFPVSFVLFWLVNVNASRMILWECLKIAVTFVTTSCNNFYYRTVKVPSLCQWEMFTMRYTSSTLVSWWCFDFSWSVMLLCVAIVAGTTSSEGTWGVAVSAQMGINLYRQDCLSI